MSNIAGKAYAMSLVTPIKALMTPINKAIFWAVGTPLLRSSLRGLLTLSLIHYARWVILRAKDFPRLDESQPQEDLDYDYMLFFSNFNGSWEQYVDSFAAAIPTGLNLLWFKNVGWPTAVPEHSFHTYVGHNGLWTDYYYSAYPMASSNDVKSAQRVKAGLCALIAKSAHASPDQFSEQYTTLLKDLQHDLSQMGPTPLVSLAAEAVSRRLQAEAALRSTGPRPSAPNTPPVAAARVREETADA